MGRYLARPAVAEYRIEEYDGKIVRLWYKDHQTGKRVDEVLFVYKFLFNFIQHISPKHFRVVGRFGLYSRRSYRRAKDVLSLHAFKRTNKFLGY
ncbi:transposase [Metabacillus bambusae]|uniref:Transposase n=1 Tax=Metabacillus bambusae TaxID=2795218 RepID=A0ABS3N0U2_9BACI|nr:transposase [Metabacillus bambusae]